MIVRIIAFSLILASSAFAKFPVLSTVPGVERVVHEPPFIWVVGKRNADVEAIDQAVAKVMTNGLDADLEALGGRFNLAIVDPPSFERQRQVYERIKDARSAGALAELFATSLSVYVYELDWSLENPLATRKIYRRGLPSDMEREMVTLQRVVAAYRGQENRPDKLLAIKTVLPLGSLVYPIHGDDIHIREDVVSLAEFQAAIKDMIAPRTWAAAPEPVAATEPRSGSASDSSAEAAP